nr:uncharacterized protein LOC117281562 [Nicotiana tomentosiformis]
MDVIGPIEPAALKGHRFILVAIDYFTKWVVTASYKPVTKKVVADFVRDRIVCRFRVLESIITDNAANLNSDLMKAMCETLKIKNKNSTSYRSQMNGAVEAANKNIKKNNRKLQTMAREASLCSARVSYHGSHINWSNALPAGLRYGNGYPCRSRNPFSKNHTRN